MLVAFVFFWAQTITFINTQCGNTNWTCSINTFEPCLLDCSWNFGTGERRVAVWGTRSRNYYRTQVSLINRDENGQLGPALMFLELCNDMTPIQKMISC
jgi:hypothetical protein